MPLANSDTLDRMSCSGKSSWPRGSIVWALLWLHGCAHDVAE